MPKKQFKLPSLGMANKSLPLKTTVKTDSSSLSDFAGSQLQSYLSSKSEQQPKNSTFSIPKLFPNSRATEQVVSIKTDERMVIDLKSALVSDSERKNLSERNEQKKEPQVEHFIPQFVDCENVSHDISVKATVVDEQCDSTTLGDLRNKFSFVRLAKFSIVGKIIRKRFRTKAVRLEYKTLYADKRFKFDHLSPDDQILRHLKKA